MVAVSNRLVTVFGGSGFVGRHLVRALAKRGFRVRVAVRRPDLARFLMTAGAVGQVHAVQANLRYPASIEAAVQGAEVVVNLVGMLNESGRNSFKAVQSFGPGAIGRAARAAGVSRYVHTSSLGVYAPESAYGASKIEGEEAARAAFPDPVIVRPAAIFGPEDDFFNKLAALARMLPVVPLIGGGGTRMQPVFVGDVAEVLARAVEGSLPAGSVYELGGPEVMTLREINEFVLRVTNRSRPLLPLPFAMASIQAKVLQFLPGKLLTPDQVRLLRHDNVVSAEAVAAGRTLDGLGIRGTTVEAEVATYLWRFRKAGQFEGMPA